MPRLALGILALCVCAACDGSTETGSAETGTTTAGAGGGGGESSGAGSNGTGGDGGASSSGGAGGAPSGTTGAGAAGVGGSGGSTGSGGAPCTWGGDSCGQGQYCYAPGCNEGVCMPFGQGEDGTKDPVCGCDGVHYWNADAAAYHGMSVLASGPCDQPTFCGGFGGLSCPSPLLSCGYVYDAMDECNISDPGGVCWGMPPSCEQLGFGGTFRDCFGNPNAPCANECEAIKSEQGHYPDPGGCPQ